MTENDIARVIFANLFPRGMCPADWDSGAVLGPNNETREQFLATARALLATPAPLSDEPVLRCNDCGGFDIEQVPETMKPTPSDKQEALNEKWDRRELGADERYAAVAPLATPSGKQEAD